MTHYPHEWHLKSICLFVLVCCYANLSWATVPMPLKPKIIISQWIEHPALDASFKGIQDELAAAGFVKGKNLDLIHHNAQGNIGANMLIAKHVASALPKPDVAIAISTPSAQCLVQAVNGRVPVVFSAVSNPKAAGLVSNLEHPEGMVTGVTDLPPVEDQVPVFKKVFPHLKKIGVIYNAGEINSVVQVDHLVKVCGKDIAIVKRCVSETKEVQAATKSILSEVDAIYIPLDNTVLAAASMVIKLAHTASKPIPVIGGSMGIVQQGAVLSVGYDHYNLGRQTGKVVLRLLKGEQPSAIPVKAMPKSETFVNLESAKKLQITIPAVLLERARKIE